jgi:ParB family chromosome partitioning protein
VHSTSERPASADRLSEQCIGADRLNASQDAPTTAGQTLRLAIDDIRVGDRLRQADQARVTVIAASIAEVGLQTPITVAEAATGGFRLVAGLHRLRAFEELGYTWIPAICIEMDEAGLGLWEVDENLARAELKEAERARFLARRKVLYEAKHPETKHHVAGGKARQKSASANLSFAADTAARTGRSVRSVQRAVCRAEKIAPDVLDKIVRTPLDKGTVLDRLAKLEPEQQRGEVNRLLDGGTSSSQGAPDLSPQLTKLLSTWQLATDNERLAFFVMIAGDQRTFDFMKQACESLDADKEWRRQGLDA